MKCSSRFRQGFRVMKNGRRFMRGQQLKNTRYPLIICRSIHDCNGSFLWVDEHAPNIFQRPVHDLAKTSLFQIMSTSSVNYIRKQCGLEIFLASNRPQVFSYLLFDQSTTLTSRISPIFCNMGEGDTCLNVMIQTRFSRHQIHIGQPREPPETLI